MKLFARDEFTAQRKGVLDRGEAKLLPVVEHALEQWSPKGQWWEPILPVAESVYTDIYRDESGADAPDNSFDDLKGMLAKALSFTEKPQKHTPEVVARFVTLAAVNGATAAAAHDDETDLDLEWVTMHDSHVRASHRAADGQTRKMGEPFHIGDAELDFPGDPNAPLDEIMGCRCVLRPTPAGEHALVASAGNSQANTSSVVVALPAKDDPVHGLGPEDSHCTLVWLGDADQWDGDALAKEVAAAAASMKPFTSQVAGSGQLGDEGAHVLHLEPHPASAVRDEVLAQPSIRNAYENTKQFPTFKPHVTLGYPDQGDISEEVPDEITFDRLALWHGDAQTEYPLGEPMSAPTTYDEAPATITPPTQQVPWHGVMVIEGAKTGDGRSFSPNSLRNRDLPLPLTWQEVTDEGHSKSHVVGMIHGLKRQDNGDGTHSILGHGTFRQTPEADRAIGTVADFGKYGVSIDADDASYEYDDESQSINFSDARICGACLVHIPAFAEAYIQLGEAPWATEGLDDAQAGDEPVDDQQPSMSLAISTKPWDGSSSRFTPEQWKASCVLHLSDSDSKSDHKLPIKEPNGDLNKNAVHNAAARISQVDAPASAISAAKAALRSAYKQLGEDAPFSADLEFDRGPGWVTYPKDTARIHGYWTLPGKPGYEKIAWGTPGDFDRCRAEVGKYLTASGEPEFINQTCALWHNDALGYYPATHAKMERHGLSAAPAISLVASAGGDGWHPPAEWFTNPHLPCATPTTFVKHAEGIRVVGHIAEWGVCHAAFPGTCVTAPHSSIDYADFLLGGVECSDGSVVRVGQITVGGGHADTNLGMRPALEHYDDVATAVVDIVVGEDEFGIWFSGALRPWATEQQKHELLAAKLSGDWREHGWGGPLELIAAHCVNTPGFKVAASVQEGRQVSLVAAGALAPRSAGEDTSALEELMSTAVAKGIEQYREAEERTQRVRALGEEFKIDPAAIAGRLLAEFGD